MHVVYLYPHFTYPGGAGIVVLETAKRLVARGVKVSIISQSGFPDLPQKYPGIHFVFVGGSLPNTISYWVNCLGIYKKVERIIDEIHPDIIFPHVFPASYWGFLYKKHNPDIPCIWFCHEPSSFVHDQRVIDGLPFPMRFFAQLSNPVMKKIDNYLVPQADYVLVNSRFTAERCREVYGISKVEVIYPGVDISEFPVHPAEKEEYILCVSQLTSFKRIDLVLDALFLLKQKGINKKLVIVGDGEEKGKLIEQSLELGLTDIVTFTGKISRDLLISYYARAQCVVFPSINEPFGLVPIEAQAAWTPVIAARSGGPMESVVDSKSGFLVKPDSVDEIVDKLLYISQNGDVAESMGIYARKNVSSAFSWEKASEQLMEVFTRYAS
ncbi:glycosyltransferase family 4 protein [Methanosphaerula subterraneus]|uniref:glycosyltransferase family 4 protein n=1 Tax=Methanosphaerula subterraneus TaxID=3350244 RepID=UPI003F861CB8